MQVKLPQLRALVRSFVRQDSMAKAARSVSASTSTVKKYFDRFKESEIPIEELLNMSNEELTNWFMPVRRVLGDYVEPDWENSLYQNKVKKIPLKDVWAEYVRDAGDSKTLSYTSFCRNYRVYAENLPASLKEISATFDWEPGEVMMIDYSGDPLHITENGKQVPVQIFVAVLPYSGYTFCKATPKQTRSDWLDALIDAVQEIGGVPQYIFVDNSTSLVTKADAHNPKICSEFQAFGEYYGTVPFPVTPGKPKHKAAVEGAVRLVQERVTRLLATRQFFSIDELNAEVAKLCKIHNDTIFAERWRLTRSIRLEEERKYLQPLPSVPFEKSMIVKDLKVRKDCLIRYNERRYSVPYGYVGKRVRVVVFPRAYTLKIYNDSGQLIAEHLIRNDHKASLRIEHFPPAIRATFATNGDRRNKIAEAGPNAEILADALMKLPSRVATKKLSGLLSHLNQIKNKVFEQVCTLTVSRQDLTYDGFMRALGEVVDRRRGNKQLGHCVTLEINDKQNLRGADYYANKRE